MKITIKKKKYEVKYTIRGLFIFEQITGKPFEIKTLLDNYIFFYSLIVANNPDNPILWDDFLDAIDNDKELYAQLNKVVEDYQKQNDIFDDGVESEDTKEGKKN